MTLVYNSIVRVILHRINFSETFLWFVTYVIESRYLAPTSALVNVGTGSVFSRQTVDFSVDFLDRYFAAEYKADVLEILIQTLKPTPACIIK